MSASTYMTVILEAAQKRAEKAVHADRVSAERRHELMQLAKQADEAPEKRMSWHCHLPYLRRAYEAGVTHEQMAITIGAIEGRAIYPQTVSKVLSQNGISTKRTDAEWVDLLSEPQDIFELVG